MFSNGLLTSIKTATNYSHKAKVLISMLLFRFKRLPAFINYSKIFYFLYCSGLPDDLLLVVVEYEVAGWEEPHGQPTRAEATRTLIPPATKQNIFLFVSGPRLPAHSSHLQHSQTNFYYFLGQGCPHTHPTYNKAKKNCISTGAKATRTLIPPVTHSNNLLLVSGPRLPAHSSICNTVK